MRDLIQFNNISKRYPGFALEGVTMEIENGSIVGLIGQNGAGKSTFIKSCLGLVHREEGSILMDGRPLIDAVELRVKMGYLPESLTFYEWMTVRRYLDFIAAFYKSWDRQYRSDLMIRFRLEDGKIIKHLSKGMRAKVALIAALCPRPEVLFLDESTSGMDPLMKHDFLEELKTLVALREVRVIIFSSHVLAEVADLCDHVAILRAGRLVHFDTVDNTMKQDEACSPMDPLQSVLMRQRERSELTARFEAALLEKV